MKKIISLLLSLMMVLTIGVRSVNADVVEFDGEVGNSSLSWASDAVVDTTKYQVSIVAKAIKGESEDILLDKTVDATGNSYDFSQEIEDVRSLIKANDDNHDEFYMVLTVLALNGSDEVMGQSIDSGDLYKYFYRVDSTVKTLDKDGNETDPNLGGTVSEKAYYYQDELVSFEVTPNEGYFFEAQGNAFYTNNIQEGEELFLGVNEHIEVTFIPSVRIKIDTGENHESVAEYLNEYFNDDPSKDIIKPVLNGSVLELNLPLLTESEDGLIPLLYDDLKNL